jgi:hypothetical protein
LALALGDIGAAHGAIGFQYAGNTYIAESIAGTEAATAAGDTLVQLVGLHTVSATLAHTTGIVLAS